MIASGRSSRLELTRRSYDASPDKNREWAGSGIDRPRGRPVTFALPTAIGHVHAPFAGLLLRSTRGCACPKQGLSDPEEERGW